ncbi:MAG: MFS transporter [Bacteroidales bacterium]|nr:MFS transporter [Bacteroidales bacterium]
MYRKHLVFVAACLGMLLFGIVFLSLGTISVFIQEKFQVGPLQVASLASSLPVGILAGSLLFGPVVDRYGYKILLTVCTGLIFLALESVARARSLGILQLSFFTIGLGGGVINGGTNALVADTTTEGKGAKLSLLGVFYGIGALGMPLVIGRLTRHFNYETVISGIGFVVLLPLVYFLVLKFPEPKQKKGFPVTEAFSMLKDPLLILMGFILFFESALEGITGNWSTTFLHSIHLSPEKALYALSCQIAAIAIVRLLLSKVFAYISTRFVMYLSFMLILSGAILFTMVTTFPAAIIALSLMGAGFAAVFPVILGYVGELYANLTGTAFGIAIVLALAGNSLLNYLVGVISKICGIRYFPYILIICIVFMVILYSIAIRLISKKIKV